ncbi:MAG: mechanosensitive ion channel family protein [Proteobacteria bacterium]|nr:MAG: mechanosensitive ion channel family protein [Pseudomonadota bacterium]
MNVQDYFSEDQWLPRVVATLVLVVIFVIGRRLVTRYVRGDAGVLDASRRRRVFYARSAFNLGMAVALMLLWLGHLQNILLSLTAVTVAVVLATKELIMCVSGFMLRTGAGLYSVGDWIEVNGVRGEVSDYNLLSTTVLELSPPARGHGYTGNVIVMPNSLFLTHPVRNERLGRHYVQHPFSVTVDAGLDVGAALDWWRAAASSACADFADEARRVSMAVDRALSADVQGPVPVIHVGTTDGALLCFQVQLFCPASRAQALEVGLNSEFLTAVAAGRFAPASPPPETP